MYIIFSVIYTKDLKMARLIQIYPVLKYNAFVDRRLSYTNSFFPYVLFGNLSSVLKSHYIRTIMRTDLTAKVRACHKTPSAFNFLNFFLSFRDILSTLR